VIDRLSGALPLLLLAALAALTFWLDRLVQPLPPPVDRSARHDPDYIVDKFSALRTDDQGRATYTLTADRLMHYPDDDTTQLTSPRLVSHRSRQAPVTITARQATVSGNGENVYFRDDVKVVRAAYPGHSELTMRTAYLHVIPDDSIAKTDQPVTITDAATTINAVGLELNSDTRILKLLARVRGTYDPGKATSSKSGRK